MREVRRIDDEAWAVPIDGWEVTRCCVDICFLAMLAGEGARANLRVNTMCTLATASGETVAVDPEVDPSAIGHFTVLLRDHVAAVELASPR